MRAWLSRLGHADKGSAAPLKEKDSNAPLPGPATSVNKLLPLIPPSAVASSSAPLAPGRTNSPLPPHPPASPTAEVAVPLLADRGLATLSPDPFARKAPLSSAAPVGQPSKSSDAPGPTLRDGSARPPAGKAPSAAVASDGPSGGARKVAFRSPNTTPTASSFNISSDPPTSKAAATARPTVKSPQPTKPATASAPSGNLPRQQNDPRSAATSRQSFRPSDQHRAPSRSASTPTQAPHVAKKSSAPPAAGPLGAGRSHSASAVPSSKAGSSSRKVSAAPNFLGSVISSSDQGRSTSPNSVHEGGLPPARPGGMQTNGSYLGIQGSWSEWADEELLLNLGPRERTRQEVLWEIVSSEERYVNDLQQLVTTFIDSLLPPRTSSSSSPTSPPLSSWSPPLTVNTDTSPGSLWGSSTGYPSPPQPSRTLPPVQSSRSASSPAVQLPIAARFLNSIAQPTPSAQSGSNTVKFSASTADGTRSPYGGATGTLNTMFGPSVNFPTPSTGHPSKSHQSLPPPPRSVISPPPAHATAAQRYAHEASSGYSSPYSRAPPLSTGKLHKLPPSSSTLGSRPDSELMGLPEDLREVLEVLRDGILQGHLALSQALKKRYEEQYPLVRSLADVFTAHSYVLREYNIYVLHLSNALGIVDSALTSGAGKKARKAEEGTEVARLRSLFQELDELAADKGESGLAISLSKPFQRLLKYPLLLQNLLFNTDPSTKEYEATVAMVEEVEHIIRSIEDEKTAVEERVKTRDVFARIEGLEREKMLIAPKPSRLLVDETPCGADGTKISATAAARRSVTPIKEKKNFRRLSDILKPNVGGQNDLWIVKFNDVSLLCQRTGTTSLPLASTASSRSTSLPELNGMAKFATTGRKHAQTRPRNLYRYVKIEEWSMSGVSLPRHGMLSMDDISRTRTQTTQPGQARTPDERDEHSGDEMEGNESDGSFGAKSRMSFSYGGGDQVEPAMPPLDPRTTSGPSRRGAVSALSTASASKPLPGGTAPLIRRRSAQDKQEKFGSRLRNADSPVEGARAASRARTPAAASKEPVAIVSKAGRVTPGSKAPWNGSSAQSTAGSSAKPRHPNTSATNLSQQQPAQRSASAAASAGKTKHLSPSPSEDSGVAMGLLYLSTNEGRGGPSPSR